jgi:CheY-like chemotaxis protein
VAPPRDTTGAPVDAATLSKSVLVVDDNADAAEMMCLLLSGLGCSVRSALDGEAAIEAVEQCNPDAILLDIGLPRMDGYEVAATLRSKGYVGRADRPDRLRQERGSRDRVIGWLRPSHRQTGEPPGVAGTVALKRAAELGTAPYQRLGAPRCVRSTLVAHEIEKVQ